MEEGKLLLRLRRGDTTALAELIRRYSPYVYAIASNIMAQTMSREDVEEVVSDTFASLWENREQIETELLKAYLGPSHATRPNLPCAVTGRPNRWRTTCCF